MTDTKIKPCPFCGGTARYCCIEDDDDDQNAGAEYIECTKCGACTNLTFPSMDDCSEIVIEKWNNRVSHER